MAVDNCLLCQGADSDPSLGRMEVWQDGLWRLTMSLTAEVRGFCYLEPKRHIEDIASLDGEEADTLGLVIANVTSALKQVLGVERVYVYIFGDSNPHLHIHLAPHTLGDALENRIIKGELVEETVQGGASMLVSSEHPVLPEMEHRRVAGIVMVRLISFKSK